MADLSLRSALAPLPSPSANLENGQNSPLHVDRHSALHQTNAPLRTGAKMPKVNDKPIVIRLSAGALEWVRNSAADQDRALSYIVAHLVEKAYAESIAQKEVKND